MRHRDAKVQRGSGFSRGGRWCRCGAQVVQMMLRCRGVEVLSNE